MAIRKLVKKQAPMGVWESMIHTAGNVAVMQLNRELNSVSGRAWSTDLTFPPDPSRDSVGIRIRLRHSCGAELMLVEYVENRITLHAGAADALASAISARLLNMASRHDCAGPATTKQPVYPPLATPSVRPKKKKKATPSCAICGGANELFPDWADACDHTPKERRAK